MAIIDREQGHQPLCNGDGSLWIVFNGEIYNHRQLRHFLATKGHRFRTNSDTEVILRAFEEFGTNCVLRLDGMFAFAIYDARSRTLFAARDPLGKKPFFYFISGGIFHFASEIKALARSPLWDGSFDLDSLEAYLALGYVVAPESIYKHVKKLEAGHWLTARAGRVETRKYWDIEQFDDERRPEPTVLEELQRLIGTAVSDRLQSEVPLGAFLSGGIDSSLVVSTMCDVMSTPPRTITIGFRNKGYNELSAASATAQWLGTRHESHLLTPDILTELDQVIGAFDEPFADSSAVPMYYLSRVAKQNVTVALTGDGGDEAFGGYARRYVPLKLETMARGAVSGARSQTAARWLGSRWSRDPRLPRILRIGSLLDNLGRDPAHAYYADLCFLKPRIARQLLGYSDIDAYSQTAVYDRVTEPYRRCGSEDPLQRTQYADLKIYLANDVLVKVDRMSMLSGVEVRCPLLDRRVVEYAFRVPATVKMPRLRSKHLLRKLASRRLSRDIVRRSKQGFEAPVQQWITGEFGPQLAGDLFDQNAKIRTLLDLQQLRGLYHRHRQRTADNSYPLWSAWVLERWMRLQRTTPPQWHSRDSHQHDAVTAGGSLLSGPLEQRTPWLSV